MRIRKRRGALGCIMCYFISSSSGDCLLRFLTTRRRRQSNCTVVQDTNSSPSSKSQTLLIPPVSLKSSSSKYRCTSCRCFLLGSDSNFQGLFHSMEEAKVVITRREKDVGRIHLGRIFVRGLLYRSGLVVSYAPCSRRSKYIGTVRCWSVDRILGQVGNEP